MRKPPTEFEDYVQWCAETDATETIHNASIRHAKVIIRWLFESAIRHQEDVRIVTGELLDSFYHDLASLANRILERSRIWIIVLESSREDLAGNEMFRLVDGHPRGEVVVAHDVKVNIAHDVADPSLWAHFVLVGDRRGRIEIDDGKKDAIASFNNDGLGEMLRGAFDQCREEFQGG